MQRKGTYLVSPGMFILEPIIISELLGRSKESSEDGTLSEEIEKPSGRARESGSSENFPRGRHSRRRKSIINGCEMKVCKMASEFDVEPTFPEIKRKESRVSLTVRQQQVERWNKSRILSRDRRNFRLSPEGKKAAATST